MLIRPVPNYNLYISKNAHKTSFQGQNPKNLSSVCFRGDIDETDDSRQRLEELENANEKMARRLQIFEQKLAQEERILTQHEQNPSAYLQDLAEQTASNLRVYHGINDSSVIEYKYPSEQMMHVTQFVNQHSDIFKTDRKTILGLIEILKNKEGHIPVEVLDFLYEIFKAKKENTNLDTIEAVIYSVTDKNGYLINDRYGAFIGNYLLESETLLSTLKNMKILYSYEPEEGQEQTVIDRVIEAAEKSETTQETPIDHTFRELKRLSDNDRKEREERKVSKKREEIINKINSVKNKFGFKKYKASITINELIIIEMGKLTTKFNPKDVFGDDEETEQGLKFIETILGDLDLRNCHHINLNNTALKTVTGDLYYTSMYRPEGLADIKVAGEKKGWT